MVFKTRFFIKERTVHNHLRGPSIKGSRSDSVKKTDRTEIRRGGELSKACRRLHFTSRQRGLTANVWTVPYSNFQNDACFL